MIQPLRHESLLFQARHCCPLLFGLQAEPAESVELREEDVLPNTPSLVTVSSKGFIKRMPSSSWEPQRRGGKGEITLCTVKGALAAFLMFLERKTLMVLFPMIMGAFTLPSACGRFTTLKPIVVFAPCDTHSEVPWESARPILLSHYQQEGQGCMSVCCCLHRLYSACAAQHPSLTCAPCRLVFCASREVSWQAT
eukprot:GHRR01025053.1.p1 GENE.GHRR01025053.1~~GHRR01025053.1.p1  ORF type:complete len:195 (-),score=25.95 GHRR01025053.1:283-867(-)